MVNNKLKEVGNEKLFTYITLGVTIIFSVKCSYGVDISEVEVTEDQSIAVKFVRHTVTGITTPLPMLPDEEGFIGVSYVTVGDIDENGTNEIIATSGVGPDSDIGTANGEVALFTWNGTDINSWTKTVLNNTFAFPNETELHDVDGDGDLNILVMDHFFTGDAPSGIYYLKYDSSKSITDPTNWTKHTVFQDTSEYSFHRARFWDLDGDDDDDTVFKRSQRWKPQKIKSLCKHI